MAFSAFEVQDLIPMNRRISSPFTETSRLLNKNLPLGRENPGQFDWPWKSDLEHSQHNSDGGNKTVVWHFQQKGQNPSALLKNF